MSRAWERLWYPEAPEDAARKLAMAPLTAASWAFGATVRLRNALYDRGTLASHHVEGARVISVGNLTVGGSGKTPVVIYLAHRLAQGGRSVAVLSRGYGRRERALLRVSAQSTALEAGDEPLLISRRCPGVAVWVGADRVALAERARAEGAQVLLLDDGMQHRRLARDVDIAVVDAGALFGNGQLLPRGPLREAPSALSRASLVWLKTDGEPTAPSWDVPTVRARHAAGTVQAPDGTAQPLSALAGRPVLALAAVARPERFRRTLEAAGARVVAEQFHPDHHFFGEGELLRATSQAQALGAEVATTEKDAVRLPAGFRAWVVRLEVEVLDGLALLDRSLGLA